MKRQEGFLFFDASASTGTSAEWSNSTCDVMAIQVAGTFTSAQVSIQGKIDTPNSDWVNLAGLDLSDFSTCQSIVKTGIFEYGVEGIDKVRAVISSISGGNITINGRLNNTSGN